MAVSEFFWKISYSRWDFILDWTLSWRMACTCLHGRIWTVPYFLVTDSWNPPPVGYRILIMLPYWWLLCMSCHFYLYIIHFSASLRTGFMGYASNFSCSICISLVYIWEMVNLLSSAYSLIWQWKSSLDFRQVNLYISHQWWFSLPHQRVSIWKYI